VVAGELKRALRGLDRRRERYGPGAQTPGTGTAGVLLLRAAPRWRGKPSDQFDGVLADIAPCPTVLAVLDALSAPRDPGHYLVVLTPCDDTELGDSVLARAIGHAVHPVNRWDLVADSFGARRLDPRLTRTEQRWLAEALLDAQPPGGWGEIGGPVLGLDTAANRLAGIRLGLQDGHDDTRLDAAALLEWTRDDHKVSRFLGLRAQERDGLAGWLAQAVGPVARVIFAMLGHASLIDAVPFGLAAAELYAPLYAPLARRGPGVRPRRSQPDGAVAAARVRAEERFFGGHAPAGEDLRRFAEAAESLVGRWNDGGYAGWADPVCERAERILADLGAADLAGSSSVLDAGFDALLAVLAEELGRLLPAPIPIDLRPAEDALRRLRAHRRAATRRAEIGAAEAAVKLARWLALPEEPPGTLADGAMRALRSWSWADRAATVLARPDTARVPRAAEGYAALVAAVWQRRTGLDRAFAQKLAAWTEGSGTTGELLLAENVLDRIVRPVERRRPPLLIVLDGMSAAVGCELAEQISAGWPWVEAGRRDDGREPAIATVPSITSLSRTSLLCGTLRTGGQPEEKAGFAAYWRGRKAPVFHKGDLRGGPGQPVNPAVSDAIHDMSAVVGVVLNTIDDTLDRGREGNAPHWRLDGVAYLRGLLDEAWRAGRPVILTADHGHVLDRGQPIHAERADSARYRAGTPGDGEIAVRGPRVLAGGGEVVAAWDEGIHYTPRKAGYHGGASAAEIVVPVIVLLPSAALAPSGWQVFDLPGHAPPWWDAPLPGSMTAGAQMAVAPARRHRPGREPAAGDQASPDALFEVGEVASGATTDGAGPVGSLGALVVASGLLTAQRAFARRAPGDEQVAALIDGLAQAGGKVPVAVAAQIAGEPVFRMSGYLAQVARLLNVDGYRVIGESDGGRTVELNTGLLRQQFLDPASQGGRPPGTPPRGHSQGGRPPGTPPRGHSQGGRPPGPPPRGHSPGGHSASTGATPGPPWPGAPRESG